MGTRRCPVAAAQENWLRQESTKEIKANFFVEHVASNCKLLPNAVSDNAWVWSPLEFSDREPKREQFALKFATKELAEKFKDAFEDAKCLNRSVEMALKLFDQVGEVSISDRIVDSPCVVVGVSDKIVYTPSV